MRTDIPVKLRDWPKDLPKVGILKFIFPFSFHTISKIIFPYQNGEIGKGYFLNKTRNFEIGLGGWGGGGVCWSTAISK